MSEISGFSHLLQVDPRKVREYLLNPEHPEGGTKARFFELLGFNREQPWDLGQAVRELAIAAAQHERVVSRFGIKYIIEGELRGAWVRTVWIVEPPDPSIRLVTAYPVRRST